MSHLLEKTEDGYAMAYAKAGGVPWHNLGKAVHSDLTPEQMAVESQTNFTVEKVPTYGVIDGNVVNSKQYMLIRRRPGAEFDPVKDYLSDITSDWKIVQNEEAFGFFNDWVAAGEMTMECAGALDGGRFVWVLAKLKESFELFGGRDRTDSYLLFNNPHKYGWSTSVSWTAIRVVCWNTFIDSLASTSKDKIIRINHRQKFDADEVKETLGVAKEKLAKYKERAKFLSEKKAKDEDIVTYFKRVFPIAGRQDDMSEMSKNASNAREVLETQPGAEFGAGTWWAPFNAVTYHLDHKYGKTDDSRLTSAWYGENRKKKLKALNVALEMAGAS